MNTTFYNSNNTVIACTTELTDSTISNLKKKTLVPRGSALMTSSGNLSPNIKAILHAASGLMDRYYPEKPDYEPTLQSVSDSIGACFELGKSNGLKRIAIPFIGGRIFKLRIFDGQGLSADDQDKQLVACIVKATIDSAKSNSCDYCLIAFDSNANTLFNNELKKSYPSEDINEHLKQGDITKFDLHNCDAIVNAANMEVRFGGGLSAAIANATGEQHKIDQEATASINKFWTDYEATV